MREPSDSSARSAMRLAVLVALAGCAEPSHPTVARCTTQCDSAGDCPRGTGDCLELCEAQYEEAQRIDCEIEYTAILDCVATLKDICDETPCSTELSQYTLCLGEFCGLQPTDPACPQK